MHWPKGIDSKGEIRRQYHHVIDVVPTILECVGIPDPRSSTASPRLPMPGVSMRYTFDDGDAADRHITQYNESIGNRSIYHEGWLAAVVHMVAWEHPHQRADDYATTSGSCTTLARTSASPTTCPSSTPRSSSFSNSCSTPKR